ncbi:MAG: sensor histidine kinase [Thermodesulfobacteriota bacterium]
MSDRLAVIAENGLQFFGKVSASLSHEIRNVLATLYENAGLLEDLVLMAEKGRPLDPNRIKDLAGRLKAQVRRGKEIAENMNRFAHSAEEPVASVNLNELLGLVTSLAQRMATMRGVTLRTENPGGTGAVRADPFLLENLIWVCLDLGTRASLQEKTLTVVLDAAEAGARIRFRGFEGVHALRQDESSVRKLGGLARAAGVFLAIEEESKEIILSIPRDADGR